MCLCELQVYIYGPLNYNPVEEWFFQRIQAGRPIPVPNSGMQVCKHSQRSQIRDISQNDLHSDAKSSRLGTLLSDNLVI